ncbi:hypothetical protein CHUAL_013613 [Chamberlinius hualienensis]
MDWVNNTKFRDNSDDNDEDEDHVHHPKRDINSKKMVVKGFEARLMEALSNNFTQHSKYYRTPIYRRCDNISYTGNKKLSTNCNLLPPTIGPLRSLVEMILNQAADLAISKIPLTIDLIRVVDFSPVYFLDRFVIISRSRSLEDKNDLIFKPVEPSVLTYMIFAMIIFTPPYVLMKKYICCELWKVNVLPIAAKLFGGLFYTYRLYFGFVSAESHPHACLRLYSFIWGIVGLFFYVSYNGMFTAALSSNAMQTNIDTLSQLKTELQFKATTLVLCTREGVINGPINWEEGASIYSEIYTTAKMNDRLQILPKGKLMNYMTDHPRAALIVAYSSSYYIANQLQNATQKQYHVSKEEFGWEMHTIIRRKGFPLSHQLDKHLWAILSSGILTYWYEYDNYRYERHYKYSAESWNKEKDAPLRLTQFTSLWYIYAIGIGSACLVFACEGLICVIDEMKRKSATKLKLNSKQ